MDLDSGYENVSEKALEFRGSGGVKIDTNLIESGIDYADFVGSVISFRLAGVPKAHLAYSVFETLADLQISIFNQLKTKHSIENFIVAGGLYENSVFYSRVMSKFAMSHPFFSKEFALTQR
jgi:hydrogenase maturation factor HypF (carbamoyltransferase family)